MSYDSGSPRPTSGGGDHQDLMEDARATERRTSADASPDEVADGGPSASTGGADWCAWCGRGAATAEGDLAGEGCGPGDDDDGRRRPAHDQLRFCSRSCLSRYKMDLFCSETRRYLQTLQGTEKPSSAHSAEDSSEQRILITPELWNQADPSTADDHGVSVAPRLAWNDAEDAGSRTSLRRRTNDDDQDCDETLCSPTGKQKVRRLNEKPSSASRRHGRNSACADVPQTLNLRGTPTMTATRKDATARSIKSETDVLDPPRPDGPTNIRIPWLPQSASSLSGLTQPGFSRGFLPSSLWPPGFPPNLTGPPTMPPLDFGPLGWPPNLGLVPPTAMLVPYPLPIPLPLPLPIPIPVPIGKAAADGVSARCGAASTAERSGNETLGSSRTEDCQSNRSNDDWLADGATPVSTTPKLICPSTPSDNSAVLDLSTGGLRSRSTDSASSVAAASSDSPSVTVASSAGVDASPYLARRSLILDAPAVDRKYLVDHAVSAHGGSSVRSSTASMSSAGKRFNHHRRRTAHIPLVKSK